MGPMGAMETTGPMGTMGPTGSMGPMGPMVPWDPWNPWDPWTGPRWPEIESGLAQPARNSQSGCSIDGSKWGPMGPTGRLLKF